MFFEPVKILFPVAIGGIAGTTASAAGSGGAVCPSTAAGGAVIFLCTAAPAAGSGFSWARRLCGWGSHCWAWRSWCAWRAWSYAVSGGFPL